MNLEQLEKYAKQFGYDSVDAVKATMGIDDEEILSKVLDTHPRCAVPDFLSRPYGSWDPSLKTLKWGFESLPSSRMSLSEQIEAVDSVCKEWSNHIDFKFENTKSKAQANILISGSNRRAEGLGTAGGTLAYAELPPTVNFRGVLRMVFDTVENWIHLSSFQQGTQLVTVCSHELGHIMGLDHDQDETALMYAFYVHNRWRLQPPDIRRAQSIYPAPAPAPAPAPEPLTLTISRGDDILHTWTE